MPLISVPDINGGKIKSYIGLVAGEAVAEEKESEGRLSSILKIIEPAQLDDFNLGEARKGAISKMLENAQSMGANAVVEILIDYVSVGGLQGSATIVAATGTAVIVQGGTINSGDKLSEEDSLSGMIEKMNASVVSEKVSDVGEIIGGVDEIKGQVSDNVNSDNVSDGIGSLPNEENHQQIKELDFATKNVLDEELEKRFFKVSRDLDVLEESFEEDVEYNKINDLDDTVKFHKSGYGEMVIMKIKEEIIGKEVVDVNASVIGKVTDVEVNFETKTVEAFIVGKGGILESLGSSKGDIIIPEKMIIAIGDKILIKSENQPE